MKISVDFENLNEVKDFAEAFLGDKTVALRVEKEEVKAEEAKSVKTTKKNTKKAKDEEPNQEELKQEETPKVEEKAQEDKPAATEEKKEETPKEEEGPKVTKEMIRDICSRAIKARKGKEVKDIFAKYGASRVPELKEEDYPAAYKEVEALL